MHNESKGFCCTKLLQQLVADMVLSRSEARHIHCLQIGMKQVAQRE